MRRLTSIVAAITFTLILTLNGPISFAIDRTVSKDISWFDYYDPRDSYEISTEAQLIGLCSLVNEKQDDLWKPNRLENFEGVTFILAEDIELTQPWTPIGKDDSAYFAGTFDGNGHTISNMNVKGPAEHSGLFGYLKGEITDLNLEGSNISNGSNSGGLAGTLSSTGRITNCTSNVTVKGYDKCGGIVGNIEGGYVEGCLNTGDISGTYKIGGVAGENWGGKILSSGNEGIVKSTRRGVATYGTGGVAGRSVASSAEIAECYNTGEIFSNTEGTGGVVGYINAAGSSVKDCYNTATININIKSSDKEATPAYAGGIVGIAGINGVRIKNCYNAGRINNADISGGIIGIYLNETDKKNSERYIINNYYISRTFKGGIGEIRNKKDHNLDRAAKGVSAGSLYKLMDSMTTSFNKDHATEYNDEITYGQTILDIFSPRKIINNALILYRESKDKIEIIKEEAK